MDKYESMVKIIHVPQWVQTTIYKENMNDADVLDLDKMINIFSAKDITRFELGTILHIRDVLKTMFNFDYDEYADNITKDSSFSIDFDGLMNIWTGVSNQNNLKIIEELYEKNKNIHDLLNDSRDYHDVSDNLRNNKLYHFLTGLTLTEGTLTPFVNFEFRPITNYGHVEVVGLYTYLDGYNHTNNTVKNQTKSIHSFYRSFLSTMINLGYPLEDIYNTTLMDGFNRVPLTANVR